MHTYMKPLLARIEQGQIDPATSSLTAFRSMKLRMYTVWRDKQDKVTKIVIDPWMEAAA